MKIERVNDHQIRCTLTRDDLAKRDLKITELAYGTDKAKELFQDMMQQANIEFGFDAEDTPFMKRTRMRTMRMKTTSTMRKKRMMKRM